MEREIQPRDVLRHTVDSIVDSIRDAIESEEITDRESLLERIHEEVDSAVIYTDDQWNICHYWNGDTDNLEDWGGNLDAKIAAYAFQIVEQEVWEKLRDDGIIDERDEPVKAEEDEAEDEEPEDEE